MCTSKFRAGSIPGFQRATVASGCGKEPLEVVIFNHLHIVILLFNTTVSHQDTYLTYVCLNSSLMPPEASPLPLNIVSYTPFPYLAL